MRDRKTIVTEHDLRNCTTPAMVHGALGRAGVLMEPFTHGGMFQPVSDWMAHEMRDNICKPYTIYERPDLFGWLIVQQESAPPVAGE